MLPKQHRGWEWALEHSLKHLLSAPSLFFLLQKAASWMGPFPLHGPFQWLEFSKLILPRLGFLWVSVPAGNPLCSPMVSAGESLLWYLGHPIPLPLVWPCCLQGCFSHVFLSSSAFVAFLCPSLNAFSQLAVPCSGWAGLAGMGHVQPRAVQDPP